MLAAAAYGIKAKIITVLCDPEVAAKRNRHGLSLKDVKRQADNLARRQLRKEWVQEVKNGG